WLLRRGLGRPLVGMVADRALAARAEPRRRTVPEWRTLADAALARGDIREAVRALYAALLALLSARGIIPDVPSLTAGECRRAVSVARPALAPIVTRATTAFERVSYGAGPGSAPDVGELRKAGRAVEAARAFRRHV